jgi:hypothetical protein
MELNHKQITEVLGLYEKCCKILDIEPPVLTFTESEYMTALITPERQKIGKRFMKHSLGQTFPKQHGFETVVLVDSAKHNEIYGQETFKGPYKIQKTIKRYNIKYNRTYTVTKKISTIEYTLMHELTHVKYPNMRHGKLFEQSVKYLYRKIHSV